MTFTKIIYLCLRFYLFLFASCCIVNLKDPDDGRLFVLFLAFRLHEEPLPAGL